MKRLELEAQPKVRRTGLLRDVDQPELKLHAPPVDADRVLLRYHGGKHRLAPWVLGHFTSHKKYVEPYGGGASVLINKPLQKGVDEVYNDIEGDVVKLFRVLRNSDLAAKLVQSLTLTPYSRDEFMSAYRESRTDVEEVRRLCVRVMMGWGSKGLNKDAKVSFRQDDAKSGYGMDWRNYVEDLPKIINRLRSVNIENDDALEVIRRNDGPGTLHYLDPPYLIKGGDKTYTHDMDYHAHQAMLLAIRKLKGKVILSGYPSKLYEQRLRGWWVSSRTNYTDSHAKRVDCLWLNNKAALATFAAGQNVKGLARL